MLLGLDFTGGSAAGQFTSNAGGAVTVNYNPAFELGGSQSFTASGSPSASSSPGVSPVQAPEQISSSGTPGGIVSPYPAGTGLATLGTVYPGSAAAQLALPQLSGSAWLMIGGVVLLLALLSGDGGRRR